MVSKWLFASDPQNHFSLSVLKRNLQSFAWNRCNQKTESDFEVKSISM